MDKQAKLLIKANGKGKDEIEDHIKSILSFPFLSALINDLACLAIFKFNLIEFQNFK